MMAVTAAATLVNPAPRTHLVIHVDEGQPKAEFLRWESAEGPKRFET